MRALTLPCGLSPAALFRPVRTTSRSAQLKRRSGGGGELALENLDRWGGVIDVPRSLDEGMAGQVIRALALDEAEDQWPSGRRT